MHATAREGVHVSAISGPQDNPVWRLVTILDRAGHEPWYGQFHGHWFARCPLDGEHDLTLSRGCGGRAELDCLDGCDRDGVLRALGLSLFDLHPAYVRPTAEAA
jgi:hypothetical protein